MSSSVSPPSFQKPELHPDTISRTNNRKTESRPKQSQQTEQRDSSKLYDDANQPENTHPRRTHVARSSNPDSQRAPATSQGDGVNILNNSSLGLKERDFMNKRPPPARTNQTRDGARRQPLGDDSLMHSEEIESRDGARRGGGSAQPAQQRSSDHSRAHQPQSRLATQTPRIRSDGQGPGSNNPRAGRYENRDYRKRVDELEVILDQIALLANSIRDKSTSRDDSDPHRQVMNRPIHQGNHGNQGIVNGDRGNEREHRRENIRRPGTDQGRVNGERGNEREPRRENTRRPMTDQGIVNGERGNERGHRRENTRPMTDQGSVPTPAGNPSAPETPSARTVVQAARKAMGKPKVSQTASGRPAERSGVVDDDSNPPTMWRAAVNSNPGAQP
jgi:hypothetical protein